MDSSDEFEKLLEKEDFELKNKDPESIRGEIDKVEKKLNKVSTQQWIYSKSLLKFGLAAWIFGISTFIASLIIYQGPNLILNAPSVSLSLLAISPGALVIITVILIQEYQDKINNLKRIKKVLPLEYSLATLEEMEKRLKPNNQSNKI